jgi:hypothetical protein
MKKFIFKLKHDAGILTLKVNAINKLNAIKYILNLNDNKFLILDIKQII